MATLSKAINQNFFESVLPTFGNVRVKMPTWNEGQKMFIFNEYESASGHRYYQGLRFCDNIVVLEKIGQYHSWTYIDSIEIYAFNGRNLELVQKRDYEKAFRNDDFVRAETEAMLKDYLKGAMKMQRCSADEAQIAEHVKSMTDRCYKSFLDKDFNTSLTQILPQLEKK